MTTRTVTTRTHTWAYDEQTRQVRAHAGNTTPLRVAFMNPKAMDPGEAAMQANVALRWFVGRFEAQIVTGFQLAKAFRPRCRSWDQWGDLLALGRQQGNVDGGRLVDVFITPTKRVGRGTAQLFRTVLFEQTDLPAPLREPRLFLVARDGLHPVSDVTCVHAPWEWRVDTMAPSAQFFLGDLLDDDDVAKADFAASKFGGGGNPWDDDDDEAEIDPDEGDR